MFAATSYPFEVRRGARDRLDRDRWGAERMLFLLLTGFCWWTAFVRAVFADGLADAGGRVAVLVAFAQQFRQVDLERSMSGCEQLILSGCFCGCGGGFCGWGAVMRVVL